jgi:hypothetical protein
MVFPLENFEGMSRVADGGYPSSSSLPYPVDFPKSAGAPMAVWVSNADAYAPGDAEVVLEYDASSPYGPFRIRERQPSTGMHSTTFIQDIVESCTTCTDARLIDLGAGIEGALLAGKPGPTSIAWLEGPYEVVVIGPAQSFSAQNAIAISREVADGLVAPSAD